MEDFIRVLAKQQSLSGDTSLIAGQSPTPMEYGQPLFVWLSRD